MARIDRAVRTTAKWLGRKAVAASALLLALVIVSGALRSGASFVYCEMMQSFQHEPCCAHEGRDASDQAELIASHVACCTSGTLPSIPFAKPTTVRPSYAPSAPLVAIVPYFRWMDGLAAPGEPASKRLARPQPIGPPKRSAARARLMVFLT